MLYRFLFKKIDNSSLILFRICFGILIACESYGAIITGWVKRTLIEPKFTFSFIGFEWLQPLPGNGMYFYFFIMGTLGLLIALGYKYRLSMLSFAVLWTGVYLMQKSSYNNHYYLLVLISFIMVFLPANKAVSLDAKTHPKIASNAMPNWVKWLIILQLFIVYTYASVAKIYGDWLDFSFIAMLMKGKANYPIIGAWLQTPWIHKVIATFGILFDFLIVPALLWKPTRNIAFAFAIFFHLFNSIVFQIGIFPYLSLAFVAFFYDGTTIKNIFFKKKVAYTGNEIATAKYLPLFYTITMMYFALQLTLPIRHYFIKDDVLWTEEGHRMSWRMMLRNRVGLMQFKVVNKTTNKEFRVNLNDYVTKKQRRMLISHPDFIWQFAQRLKKEYAEKGETIEVYAQHSKISINGKRYEPFIDGNVNLAAVPWQQFTHHEWILPSPYLKK